MEGKVIISIFLFALIISGCGIDKTYDNGEVSLQFSQAVEAGGSPLTDSEMAVALRVCYAFRSKRTKFIAELLETNVNFQFQENNCEGNSTRNTTVSTTLKQLESGGPLSFEATAVGFSYNREVYTDISGVLAQTCTQVLKGETPLNVLEFNNEINEYTFSSGIYDSVDIKVGSKKAPTDTVPTVSQVIRLEVLTNQQSSGDFLGIVYKHTRYYPCDGDAFKNKVQTFIAP